MDLLLGLLGTQTLVLGVDLVVVRRLLGRAVIWAIARMRCMLRPELEDDLLDRLRDVLLVWQQRDAPEVVVDVDPDAAVREIVPDGGRDDLPVEVEAGQMLIHFPVRQFECSHGHLGRLWPAGGWNGNVADTHFADAMSVGTRSITRIRRL